MTQDLYEELKSLTRSINQELVDFEPMMKCDDAYLDGLRYVNELLIDIVIKYGD